MDSLELRRLPLDELARTRDPGNAKRHALGALERSMDRFGFIAPVLLNAGDNTVLAGHGRIAELLDLLERGMAPPVGVEVDAAGRWLVPTVVGFDLDAVEAAAYRVADNRLVELGGWDDVRLAATLEELSRVSGGLDGVGFTVPDLEQLLADLARPSGTAVDPDEVPPVPLEHELRVRRGDIWRLGRHRVCCGDATDTGDVAQLLGTDHPAMAFVDPPYNVALGDHSGAARGRRRRITNDALSPAAWAAFVEAWGNQLIAAVDGAIYVCMSSREWPTVARILAEVGGHWSDTIIWDKGHFTLGRSDFQRGYEPIWYGWRQGAEHFNRGDRNESDVWRFPQPFESPLHPAMKPVALVEHALELSSQLGDRVLDLFLGSGTTLIAAERTDRCVLGLELEPVYVQVAIERWQRLTGAMAELESRRA